MFTLPLRPKYYKTYWPVYWPPDQVGILQLPTTSILYCVKCYTAFGQCLKSYFIWQNCPEHGTCVCYIHTCLSCTPLVQKKIFGHGEWIKFPFCYVNSVTDFPMVYRWIAGYHVFGWNWQNVWGWDGANEDSWSLQFL